MEQWYPAGRKATASPCGLTLGRKRRTWKSGKCDYACVPFVRLGRRQGFGLGELAENKWWAVRCFVFVVLGAIVASR